MPQDDFDFFMTGLARQEVLIPAARKALYDPDFEGFDVPVEPFYPRAYDGRFHPSSQAAWTVRQLYLYLVSPADIEVDRMPLTGVLAVTAGKFWHEFFQRIWLRTGELLEAEAPVVDLELNIVGHTDGLLANGEGLEIKTINPFQIGKVVTEAVLKEKKYAYWAQTQDYLMVLGLAVMRYFMINPSFPFEMQEFTVQADKAHQARRAQDYRDALAFAQQYPDPAALKTAPIPSCCAPKSKQAKECPVRYGCPIGQVR